MGVKWEDDVWFQIVEDEDGSQSESQTSDVMVYQIFGFEGKTLSYSLTIIDTPGYGDTRGTEKDEIIRERLLDLFSSDDGVHEVNAVGLVLKATENRVSDRLKYIFDSVVSLFGKDMEKKIVALITHSDGLTPENVLQALKIKCAKDEKNQPVYFLFDNCQDEDRTEDTEDLQHADKTSTKGMRQFKEFLDKTGPQNLKTTVDVLNERIRLTACIHNLQERVEFIELKQKEIQQTQEALKKHEQEMKNNEKFTVEVEEVYKVKQKIRGGMRGLFYYNGAVCCTVCEENCHYPGCTVAWSPRDCDVMKNGRCTSCTNECPVSDHVKEEWIYVKKTRRVKKTKADVREKYKKAESDCATTTRLLKNLQKQTEELIKEKHQLLDETFQHVDKLEQIALNADSLSTYVHLDFLIEKMKEKGDTEKVQKLEEMRKRVDEGTKEMKNTNASLKYEDIMSGSVLIRSGSPAVYQLRPKTENIGTLRRITLGEKNVTKENKTILLVGETGTGKSSLINTLVNYTMGVKWEDDVWFQIVENEKRSQSESQTSDVIVYQIFGFEGKTLPYSLTIIDTPGYGDTRGIEHDVKLREKLYTLFWEDDGVHEVNAVGLVRKAAENQLNDRLKYIFDSVVSLFRKDMEKNIAALITHSNGRTPQDVLQALNDANIKCAKNEENQTLHFMFNNCQSKQKTKKNNVALKSAWDLTMAGVGQFTDFLTKTSHQKVMTCMEWLDEHYRPTACIQNLQERIELTELKQKEIQQTQDALQKYEQEMKKDEEFTIEVDEVYKDEEFCYCGRWLCFYEGATCCKVCEENCHYPGCILAQSPTDCLVMIDGRCTSCTKKCPVSDHMKGQWIYANKTRKVQRTLKDVKKKYEKNMTGSQSQLGLMESLEKELEDLQKDEDQWLEETFQHVVKLDQIDLNEHSLSTQVLSILIENMKQKGFTEIVQRLEEMKSRVDKDEGMRAGL